MARQIKVPHPLNQTNVRNEWEQRQLHPQVVKRPVSISRKDKTFNNLTVDVAKSVLFHRHFTQIYIVLGAFFPPTVATT
jgi:hypothetical protein